MGYTTYTCVDCGDTYVSDYTDKIPHDYEAVVTEPTCTTMGFTTYTCRDCGDTYVSDYTEELPHNYGRTAIQYIPVLTAERNISAIIRKSQSITMQVL